MDQDAYAPNMPFPAAQLLVQSGITHDLTLAASEQGQVAAQVDFLAPFVDDFRLRNAMFDKHAFLGGHGQKEFVKSDFVGRFQRAQLTLETARQRNVSRVPFC